MKGTSVPRFDDLNKSIVFSLKKDLYNIMCSPRTTPWLLMILVLPIEVERWVVVTDEDLISSGTMIWCDVSSSEAMVGDSEVKIRIPTTNKVTEQWLHHALFNQLEMMQ